MSYLITYRKTKKSEITCIELPDEKMLDWLRRKGLGYFSVLFQHFSDKKEP